MIDRYKVIKTSKDQIISAFLGDVSQRPVSHAAGLLDGQLIELLYRSVEAKSAPAAIVVGESEVSDLFVWIETYAPQFSPITQHCRVLTRRGVGKYVQDGERRVNDASRVKLLTGLIMGEVIAQNAGDPMQALDAATLAHAQSTYSFAMARSHLLWPEDSVDEGLTTIFEDMQRHGLLNQRRVAPDGLSRVWNIALRKTPEAQKPDAKVLLAALGELAMSDNLSPDTLLSLARYYEPARELISVEKSTAEERVHAFDRLLTASNLGSSAASIELFCIAYAAIGIGGGTTRHMNLLAEVGERNPLVWLWFGLLGSIGQDAKWHPMFARLARLVSRELTYSFDALDPPRADVDWKEARACGGAGMQKWLLSMPRSQARSVAIELQPGVSLTVSISQPRTESRINPAPILSSPSIDLVEFDLAISQLWAFRQRLAGQSGDRPSEPKKSSAKRSRSRRNVPPKGGELI